MENESELRAKFGEQAFSPEFAGDFEMVEVPLPNCDLVGLEIRLSQNNGYSGQDVLKSLGFLNEAGEDNVKMYEKFKSKYAFILVKNIDIPEEAIDSVIPDNEMSIETKNTFDEQEMHRDDARHASDVFALYNPKPPYKGRTGKRMAPTQLMDADIYWGEAVDFMKEFAQRVERGEAEWPVEAWPAEQITTAVNEPSEIDIYSDDLTRLSKYYIREGMTDEEAVRQYQKMALDYIVNVGRNSGTQELFLVEGENKSNHQRAINERCDKYIYRHYWEPGDLLIVNNSSIVHSMGLADSEVSENYRKNEELPVVRLIIDRLKKV